MTPLSMRLFGTFEVTLDGTAVSGFASDKVRALLIYLAIESDQPQRREKLAGLLWPDYPEASALANLRTALANLRTAIGDRASIGDASATPPYLLISRQTIQFNRASGAWIDVDSYIELLNLADLTRLEQAAQLYRGDLLEGFSLGDASPFEEWALLERERYRRLTMDALGRLTDGYLQRGDYERALLHAWRQVELDAWRESAHQQLMQLLALSGRRTEALIQYETCCRLLAEELGVPPAENTVALYEQIRSGRLSAPVRPPVRSHESAVEPPPFTSQDEAADIERPVFVARESELDRLGAGLGLACDGQGRVLFVSGEAGSGKTALMAEFAHRAMETHRDLVVASGECSAYSGFGDPYLPFRGLWAMLTGDVQAHWTGGAIQLDHARRLQAALPVTIEVLLERGYQVLDVLVQRASLLSDTYLAGRDGDPWLEHLCEWVEQPRIASGRVEDSQLFQQTTNVLRELSRAYPLLLIIDDLQWGDPASISMLFHLGRRLEGSRILLLAAYRPDEVCPESGGSRHPLQKLLAELRRTYGEFQIDLDQFEEPRGRAFVDAWLDTEPNRLGEDFRSVLLKHTAGHPLFTIELLRSMQERGELYRDEAGCWAAGPMLNWSHLSPRVEGVIEERVGRLDEELREVLSVASVEGEQFTVQVLEQRPALAGARRKLFEAREKRVHPGRDEKVLTSWNGLMLAAFAEAARAFSPSPQPSPAGRGDHEARAEIYRQVAKRNAEFLLRELRLGNGRLLRTWKARPERTEGTGEAKLNGYLEDYSYLIEGLLELYQTTFEPHWFVAAQELAETMLEHFADSQGTLYDTSDDHETLITRPRDLQDKATPSGNAMAVTALLKLAGFTNDLRCVEIAHQALVQMQPMLAQYPLGFGQWLQALAYALSKPKETAIVGDPNSADTQALLSIVRDGYRPFQIVALGAPDGGDAADGVGSMAPVPLLQNRGLVDGQAAAYVCRAFACQAPVTSPQALEQLLGVNIVRN